MDKTERETAIENAAYKVLIEKGFKGASMLAVARAAKASNETMYSWYGDKVGLFAALIARNAHRVEAELTASRAAGGAGLDALDRVGRALLAMLVDDRAIALNRAAAADQSGVLGAALATGGRERIAPLLGALIGEAAPEATDHGARAETYIALLVGDVQIRRVIGATKAPSPAQIDARANRAMARFRALYPSDP